MAESPTSYLQRLADIKAAGAEDDVDPRATLDRAAGLLAGHVGCRVREAYAHLLRIATEQGRDAGEVAAEALAVLETPAAGGARRVRVAVDRALGPLRQPPATGREPVRAPADLPAGGWPGMLQQLLDAVPGAHAWLTPVRDPTGEVTDFLLAAASPEAVDVAGRRGGQLVGLSVREVYPTTVDGPIWQAYRQVLADGAPCQVGPLPYTEQAQGVPATSLYSVRVHRWGDGLLIGWVRHDDEARQSERIRQTERLGNLGWGEWDLVTGQVVWSDELYLIYERDPADGPVPGEEQDAMTLPEDRAIRRQAAEIFDRGETVDITYRVHLNGRIKYLRTVADAVRDVTGRPLKVYGIVQDVTARESARAKLAAVEEQLRAHQQSLAAEHRLAVQLQQIVLPIPETPVDLTGLRIAVRYLPAEQASHVGGDWYHAADAADGSVVLAVGDVAGHGIDAATTMARLRHALAALTVTVTTDPAELLAHLNRLLYAGNAATGTATAMGTATAVVARYVPADRTLVWAQAGHPAPLHARDGVTTELARPRGPLLGAVPDPTYATAGMVLEPRDLLLLYTDGLIEHPQRSLRDGLAPVVATLDEVSARRGEQPLADLLARLHRANPHDDTCILAARPLPLPAAAWPAPGGSQAAAP